MVHHSIDFYDTWNCFLSHKYFSWLYDSFDISPLDDCDCFISLYAPFSLECVWSYDWREGKGMVGVGQSWDCFWRRVICPLKIIEFWIDCLSCILVMGQWIHVCSSAKFRYSSVTLITVLAWFKQFLQYHMNSPMTFTFHFAKWLSSKFGTLRYSIKL